MENRDGSSQILDSHCHFWQLSRSDYGWLQTGDETLASIRMDFGPFDYPAKRNVIAVQAAPTVAETDYLLALATEHTFISGVVGWIDLTSSGSIATLKRWSPNPKLKSVRPMLQDIEDTEWLLTAPRSDVLGAIKQLGLRFDALITERHLPVLAKFAADNPEIPIVVDHGAKPQPGDKSAWEQGMRALSRDGRIHCKLSGLLTEFSRQELRNPKPSLDAIFGRLLDWFGPNRLMWGSDWPVLTLSAGYEDWFGYVGELLDELSPTERAAIMGGTAIRFYGIA
ncbi:amidohydrolase family protein [Rhizobium sp. 2MFCol3.1]|uniref:amidohydrolase family protein n=1 Tax=Rhizobium sp. 2MFCol3.1 TaxID=1246459 RepID=UPI001FD8AC6D|nr:amidohydrolase family protein [Rhizobium sp. 2MFCol3.1]